MLIKSKEKIVKDYDVIVIGSGLGGMTAANKLAKNGRSVLLLEAHNKLGGFATWFYRAKKKHVFDVSLHGFPAGMKKTCRKYWNKEIADHIVQLKSVKFINPQYSIESEFTKEDFTNKLVENFHLEREKVEDFYRFIENMNFYDDQSMTNGELFEKFFPGRNDVARFLMEPIVYANGSTLEDPAITYGIVFTNFMKKGVFTFKGGTDHLIKMMQEELLTNGVDIKKHAPVEKTLFEDGKVCGVSVKDQEVRAKAVVSNANFKSTIFKMVGEERLPQDFAKKAKESADELFLMPGLYGTQARREQFHFIGDLVFTSTHPDF